MNLDDPRLTAFALGELPPDERGEFENLLRTDPKASAEVAETMDLVRILRGGLQAEEGAPLGERRRDAILRAASLAGLEHRPIPVTERQSPQVLTHPSWWNRPGPWQAIAACAVVGFGIYALSVPPPTWRSGTTVANSDLVVPTPRSDDGAGGALVGPASAERPNDPSGSPALKTNHLVQNPNGFSPEKAKVPIRVEIPGNAKDITSIPVVEEDPPAVGGGPVEGNANKAVAQVPKGPRVIGSDPKDARASMTNMGAKAFDQQLKTYITRASQVKVGVKGSEFMTVFRKVQGVPQKFEMIDCPSIKLEASFVDAEGQATDANITEDFTLKSIIRPPYLELGE